jgi:hypothetical protein
MLIKHYFKSQKHTKKSYCMNTVCKAMQSVWSIIKVTNKYQHIHFEKHVKFQVFCITTHTAFWVNSDTSNKPAASKALVGTHLTTLCHSTSRQYEMLPLQKPKISCVNQERVFCIVHFNNNTNTFSLKLNILPTETAWSPRYED